MKDAVELQAPEYVLLADESPDVSVIVINWNTAPYLARCLDSLDGGALDGLRAEVWVIDNASWDGSAQMVQERYPWVRLQANTTNLGFAAANNAVMRRARGQFLLLLNADTVVPPATISALVARLRERPEVAAAACRQIDAEGRDLESYYFDYMDNRVPQPAPLSASERDRYGGFEVAWVWGAVMLMRREAFQQIGGLDEQFFMYYEDMEWCWRSRKAGWRIVLYPDLHVVHFVRRSTSQELTHVTAQRLVRGELAVLERHMPPRRYRNYLIARFVYAMRGVAFYRLMLAIAPNERFRMKYFRYREYVCAIVQRALAAAGVLRRRRSGESDASERRQ